MKDSEGPTYTCDDYRAEMILLGLQQRLRKNNVDDADRKELVRRIRELEEDLGLD